MRKYLLCTQLSRDFVPRDDSSWQEIYNTRLQVIRCLGPIFQTGFSCTDSQLRPWIVNYIHINIWNVNTHPCPNFILFTLLSRISYIISWSPWCMFQFRDMTPKQMCYSSGPVPVVWMNLSILRTICDVGYYVYIGICVWDHCVFLSEFLGACPAEPTKGRVCGVLTNVFTHWGRVTQVCVSRLTIIGSDKGLSPLFETMLEYC